MGNYLNLLDRLKGFDKFEMFVQLFFAAAPDDVCGSFFMTTSMRLAGACLMGFGAPASPYFFRPNTTKPAHMCDNARIDFEFSGADMEAMKNLAEDGYGAASIFPVFARSG